MPETFPVDRSTSHPYLGGIPLVFGGNVLGWTADRDQSFAVLDAFYQEGGRMIDTAEGYSSWVPGHKGGESETILGEWLESRGVRSDMRIATKVGQGGGDRALSPERVAIALNGSLERLRTDYVDLYYAHRDDMMTPLDEVVDAFNTLYQSGCVKELGASNYSTERLTEVVELAIQKCAQPFTILQPLYNLVERDTYEGPLQDLCVARDIATLPFYGLASGFLSGKYENASQWAGLERARGLDVVASDEAWAQLAALRTVAAKVDATPAQVALAWLRSRPGVAAPIASATNPEQIADLAKSARLTLDQDSLDALLLNQA